MIPWPSWMTWAEPTQQPQPWGHPNCFLLTGPPDISWGPISVYLHDSVYSHCRYRAPILLPVGPGPPNFSDPEHAIPTTKGCLLGTLARRRPQG